MSPSGKSRRELEHEWRHRVEAARQVYVCSVAQHIHMVGEFAHMARADGSFAVASARRAEALALNELNRAMKIYADLVVKGKMPPPDDEQLLF